MEGRREEISFFSWEEERTREDNSLFGWIRHRMMMMMIMFQTCSVILDIPKRIFVSHGRTRFLNLS